MSSNQEKLDYINGPAFKEHIWQGTTAEEQNARATWQKQANQFPIPYQGIPSLTGKSTNLETEIGWMRANFQNVNANFQTVNAKLDQINAKLDKLGGGVDGAATQQAVTQAVTAAMAGFTLTLAPKGK